MGYLYQQVCSIFKFESFNTARIRRRMDVKRKDECFRQSQQLAQEIIYLSGSYLSYSM
jgi:DNA polymerase III delta prime subunit